MNFIASLTADAENYSLSDALMSLPVGDLVFLITSLFTALVVSFITLVSMWRVFAKAGISGWKSLIPIYNAYLMYKRFWKVSAFKRYILWVALISVVSAVLELVSMNENVFLIVCAVLVLLMWLCVINIMSFNYHLAKSFDRGFLFSLGLSFLSPCFHWILGLGDCDYVGDAYDYYY